MTTKAGEMDPRIDAIYSAAAYHCPCGESHLDRGEVAWACEALNAARSEVSMLRRHLIDAITLLRDAKHDAQQEEKQVDAFLASLPNWNEWLPTLSEMRGLLSESIAEVSDAPV